MGRCRKDPSKESLEVKQTSKQLLCQVSEETAPVESARSGLSVEWNLDYNPTQE